MASEHGQWLDEFCIMRMIYPLYLALAEGGYVWIALRMAVIQRATRCLTLLAYVRSAISIVIATGSLYWGMFVDLTRSGVAN